MTPAPMYAGRSAAVRFAVCRAGFAAILALALFAQTADAQGRWKPQISFDAFGALGLVHSTERNADFVESTTRGRGPGFTNAVDASVDSRVAAQATVSLGSKLTGVLQVMVEQTMVGDYDPHVEWANLSYSFTPDLRVRGGRIVAPAFMVSEARKVSYATPWVRPPVELYGMVPIYFLDGVDVMYRRRFGEWTGGLHVVFGETESDFANGTFEASGAWVVNTTFVRGPLMVRTGLATARLYVPMVAPLFDGFRAFGPEGEAIAERYDVDGRHTQYATAGFEYDPGDWFTMAEVGWTDSRSAFGEKFGTQVTSGVRLRAFTPYASYGRADLISESETEGLTLTGLPPEYAQAAAQLNAGLNALLQAPAVQQTVTIGTRWDFMPNVALKAQLDFIDVLGASSGTFINLQPGFERGGSARLFSVATAFVF